MSVSPGGLLSRKRVGGSLSHPLFPSLLLVPASRSEYHRIQHQLESEKFPPLTPEGRLNMRSGGWQVSSWAVLVCHTLRSVEPVEVDETTVN